MDTNEPQPTSQAKVRITCCLVNEVKIIKENVLPLAAFCNTIYTAAVYLDDLSCLPVYME